MALFSRSVRKFTTAESFRLFMEGLRAFQIHEAEGSKHSEEDPPNRAALVASINTASGSLSECVGQYPNDLLPRYYFGIVLGLQAQTEQCIALENQLDQPNSPQTGNSAADKFFLQAATQFEDTAARARRGDLRVYALYNQAQVLAKLNDVGNQKYWDQALQILNRIKPFRFTVLPLGKRILARIYAFFRSEENLVAEFAGKIADGSEGATGIAASAASALADSKALELQIEMLDGFIKLRKAARNKDLRLGELP